MDKSVPIYVCIIMISLLSVDCQEDKEAFIRLGEAMKNQTRMSGGTVKLKCTVTGYPLPMYTWYKDGEMINAGFKTVKSGSRLILRNLKVTDSGHYECEARNMYGIVRSNAFLVVKRDKEEPYFNQSASRLTETAVPGTAVVLSCEVRNLGRYKVAWRDPEHTVLTYGEMRLVYDNRISVERPYKTEWNLMIRDVKPSDQGTYTCEISTDPVKRINVTLNIGDNQDKLNTVITKTQLFPGILLRCEYPDMTSSLAFEWTRNGHPLNEFDSLNVSYTQDSSILEIFRLTDMVYDLVYICAVMDMENRSVITRLRANFTWTDMYSDQCTENKPPLCKNMNYGSAYVPSYLGPQNGEDAALQIHQFFPLVKVGCSKALQPFLCYLYAPPCGDALRLPCRSLCLEARQGCEPVMTKFGYNWPVLFDCMSFPEDNCWTGHNATSVPQVMESNEFCVEHSLAMCRNLGYSSVYMPPNRNETIDEVGLTLHQYWPIVEIECSKAFRPFVCYTYLPPCHEPRLPCKSLCEEARVGCGPLLRSYGFKWPNILDCEVLPETDCLSAYALNTEQSYGWGNNTYSFGPTNTSNPTTANSTINNTVMSSTSNNSKSGSCMNNDLPMCQEMGYSSVYIPNNRTIKEIDMQLSEFIPLVSTRCSRALKPFLCYKFAPPCSGPQSPCRSLCEESRRGCEPVLMKLTFAWPNTLDCMRLPETDCLSYWNQTDNGYPHLMDNDQGWSDYLEEFVRGGGAIFIRPNSSTYIREYKRGKYEPITSDLYVNPGNFDLVKIEGLRTDPSDCPQKITECYVIKFTRFGIHPGVHIALAFTHGDEFDKVRSRL